MLYITNTPVLTTTGEYRVSEISIERARQLLKEEPYTSAVGHSATAKMMSNILQADIPFNRTSISMEPGDIMLALRLHKRLPEGTIITSTKDLQQIGYDLWLITREK